MTKSNWIMAIIIFLMACCIFFILQNLIQDKIKIKQLTILNTELQNKINEIEIVETKSKSDIKNYILTHYKTIPSIIATEITENILISSKKHGISPITIVAVMEVESSFNPALVGPKTKYGKARGLMQVMPKFWVKELNKNKYDFHDIKIGIDSGTYILKKYLVQKKYNMKKALYKYVNGDNQYVANVYNAMGKFVVFRNIVDIKKQKSIENKKEFIEKKQEIILEYNYKKEDYEPFVHVVKYHGETLSLMAKWYTGKINNWKKILEINSHIVPEKMQIGAQIIIPNNLIRTRIPMTKEFVDEYL